MFNNYNGKEIQADINWHSSNKEYQDLLSRIADGCLTHSSNGLASFLPMVLNDDVYNTSTKRRNQINNCYMLALLLLNNYRYKYNIMKQPMLYKLIYDILIKLIKFIQQNHALSDIYINLVMMFIRKTMSTWTYEHVVYMDKINMFEELCIMVKQQCLSGVIHIQHTIQIISEITQIFYILSKDISLHNQTTLKDYYIIKFADIVTKHWQSPKLRNKEQYKRKKIQFFIHQQQLKQYQNDITKFMESNSNKFKDLQFIKKYKNIICRNSKCSKTNF